MRFWDSSALLPLVVEEARSPSCRTLRRTDRAIAVWTLTRLELVSATRRLVREKKVSQSELGIALRRIEQLSKTWAEVDGVLVVRERAERVLAVHPLTAADALQLAAALVLVRERPRNKAFVTADDRLASAAENEGFEVLVPSES